MAKLDSQTKVIFGVVSSVSFLTPIESYYSRANIPLPCFSFGSVVRRIRFTGHSYFFRTDGGGWKGRGNRGGKWELLFSFYFITFTLGWLWRDNTKLYLLQMCNVFIYGLLYMKPLIMIAEIEGPHISYLKRKAYKYILQQLLFTVQYCTFCIKYNIHSVIDLSQIR